jgi:hypothetical protein
MFGVVTEEGQVRVLIGDFRPEEGEVEISHGLEV